MPLDELNIQLNENSPIYLQIIALIKRDIVTGSLALNERLPSIRDLASLLQVNANTVARAYQELERLGITYTQRGMGAFVTGDANLIETLKCELSDRFLTDFVGNMHGIGYSDQLVEKSLHEYLQSHPQT